MSRARRGACWGFWILSCALAGIWLPHGASATERAEDEVSAEHLLFMEVPVVITASRMEQPASEAPSSVSIVTAEEIRKYGHRTLADILRSVRGLYVTYDRNYAYLGVRGFSRPGDYTTGVLLLVDGHRTNENVYEQAYIGTDFPVDVDLIDRVEIVRGPGSSLFGSNGFFAVVNVITRRPADLEHVEVSAEAGSLDTFKTRLSAGKVYGNGLEAMASGTHYQSQGEERLYFKEFDDPATNSGIAEDLDHDRFTSLLGELSYKGFVLQSAYSDRKKGVPTASFESAFDDDRFFTRDRHFYVDLKYERTLAGGFNVMSRANYNHYSYGGEYPYDSAGPGVPASVVANRDHSVGEWFGAEAQIRTRVLERHRLVLGAEYRDNVRQEQRNYDPTEVYLDEHGTSRLWAVYAEDDFSVLRNLILNAGVRYDHYSTFGPTTNPRIALIYNPFEDTIFKLIYGTAFRAPSAYELSYHSLTQKANPDLKPETIRALELVCEQRLGNHLRGTVALYRHRIRDLINATTDSADGFLVITNTGQVEAQGVELELEGKWEDGLTGRVSYAFQRTRDEQTAEILSNSPEQLAKANLILPLLRSRIFLGLEEQYTSKRKTLTGDFAKAFYLTNVTLFGRFPARGLEASVSVYNLFDYRYGDPGSEEHVQDIIPQDGRSFRVKLTYRF